ncbi:MAG: ThuA domain-containing protein [Planctomycetia bacterium]|nr:ThuA domain-containing protein [Planctomycetia bacterium]
MRLIPLFLIFCVTVASFAQTLPPQPAAEEITSGKADESYITVLLVDGQGTHNWRETTPVLKRSLEETGLFEVQVVTAPEAGKRWEKFRPDFSAYDVTLLNYSGETWPESVREDLLRYVAQGGGLVVYHAAISAFPDWGEYLRMIGMSGWKGRNETSGPYWMWQEGKLVPQNEPGPAGEVLPGRDYGIGICDANHPITKGFPPLMKHKTDELYTKLRGQAEGVTVLEQVEGWPVLWTVHYGKGRVLVMTYGHAGTQCRSVAFLAPFVRGMQWAALGLVTIPVPPDIPTDTKAFTRP